MPVGQLALVYVAAMLNSMRWRFSYGRKCFRAKFRKMEDIPVVIHNGSVQIDESFINKMVNIKQLDTRPKLRPMRRKNLFPTIKWETKPLNEIFNLVRGDFHSLTDLGEGTCATISRTEKDNGVVGYFEQPEGSVKHPPGLVTVSTVSGDAFVQVEDFIATDNVIVCVPHHKMRATTAFFIASMINHQKWRYGYGRQCYKKKLSSLAVQLPWKNGIIDESAIEKTVSRQLYWPFVSKATNTP